MKTPNIYVRGPEICISVKGCVLFILSLTAVRLTVLSLSIERVKANLYNSLYYYSNRSSNLISRKTYFGHPYNGLRRLIRSVFNEALSAA
jgi:hypothetical protein